MGKGAMGLFGTNMADFQLGLAMDDKAGGYLETDEEIAQARTRRPVVWRRLHAIFMNRLRERRPWVVSFSILRPFGPSRATSMLRAWRGRCDGVVARMRRRPDDHTRVHAPRRPLHFPQDQGNHLSTRVWPRARGRF